MTMITSESLASLAPALALAQGELEDASKSSKNPHFNSKYADLAEVLQTMRPVLSKHGLSLVQTVGDYDTAAKTIGVTTMLLHKSGEFIRDTLQMLVGKNDAQGIGSSTTYARRYGAAAIVGISQEDDDGNKASARQAAPATEGEPAKARASKAKPASEPDADAVAGMIAEANAAKTEDQVKAIAPRFARLAAADQTRVLPAIKAARARIAGEAA